MRDLQLVFEAVANWIGQFLALCTSNWLLSIILFLAVLNLIVSVILGLRGGRS